MHAPRDAVTASIGERWRKRAPTSSQVALAAVQEWEMGDDMQTRVQLDLTPALAKLGRAKPAAQEAADPSNLAKGPALSKAPLRIQGGPGAVLRGVADHLSGLLQLQASRLGTLSRCAAAATLPHHPPPAPKPRGGVGAGHHHQASKKQGNVHRSAAWLNPRGGMLAITQLQEGAHSG